MNDKIVLLQRELIINKTLYDEGVINIEEYEIVSDKLLNDLKRCY